jgi:uncharacterized protein (TIGR02246 family)
MSEFSSERRAMAAAAAAFIPLSLAPAALAAPPTDKDADLAELRALLAAHDKAFTAHDLEGVLKTYSPGPTTAVIGTGPGELWVGKEEISEAYRHFFRDFEPGKQDFEYVWRHGRVGVEVAWMATVGKITMTKAGHVSEFGMNLTVVAEKAAGRWAFSCLHFSNLTPCLPVEAAK